MDIYQVFIRSNVLHLILPDRAQAIGYDSTKVTGVAYH